jgi:hypothetical protein
MTEDYRQPEAHPSVPSKTASTSTGLPSPASPCSPLQFLYTVPEISSRDIQSMSVWSQEMNRLIEHATTREVRAAFEWFKSWGKSRIKELEANTSMTGGEPAERKL